MSSKIINMHSDLQYARFDFLLQKHLQNSFMLLSMIQKNYKVQSYSESEFSKRLWLFRACNCESSKVGVCADIDECADIGECADGIECADIDECEVDWFDFLFLRRGPCVECLVRLLPSLNLKSNFGKIFSLLKNLLNSIDFSALTRDPTVLS